MPKTRGNGQGTIRARRNKAGKITSWRAELMVGYDESGKRKVWRASYPTKTKAVEGLAQAIADHAKGELILPEKATVAEYLARWLNAIKPSVDPRWFHERERYVQQAIVPKLGAIQLGKLNRLAVQSWVSTLVEDGRSPRWIEVAHGTLRKALADAVDWQVIPANPADRTKLPKAEHKEPTVWTPEQVRAFLTAVEGDDDAELYALAILSGARAGELCALTWADVDWERRAISINRSVSRVTGQGLVVADTKTRTSRRLIVLPPEGIAALRRQQARLEDWALRPTYQDQGLVFPKRSGGYRSADAPRRKLQKVAEELGLPVLTFHQLRHLHGSLLVALGVSLKVVQQRLGHSSIDVTADRYAHVLPGLDADAAKKLGELLG